MIERYPEGTEEIPFPHKIFHWEEVRPTATPTLTIEVPPSDRLNAPKLAGWTHFFVGFHGYDKPCHLSYRPTT
jgi:hypothetical protein